ncbi:hypothetical protein [Comamonas odontotermitis]|uniref:hypothetical protein n=1 Tax=Comamonas odontotermitis TaxID=379895 RepID=UPI001CC7ABC5|nr:hypothetical protein [Comamonas odontotermitis]UBB15360.1 hypothetical protein LAD35_10755 [Comamonas odontotermitis]
MKTNKISSALLGKRTFPQTPAKSAFVALFAGVFLVGCSGKPSSAEIEKAMTLEVQKNCEYASVTNVEVLNTQYGDPQNKERIHVKFTGDVNVKITGKLLESWDNFDKANEIFWAWGLAIQDFNKEIDEARSKIDDAYDAERAEYKEAMFNGGASPELWEQERVAKARADEKRQQMGEWIKKNANEIFEKYDKQAQGMLSSYLDNGIRRFDRISKPTVPFGCMSFDPKTPLGLLYENAAQGGKNIDPYFSRKGAVVGMQAERTMVKTEKGWMLLGQM